MSETYVAFQNPVYVMIKSAGASCNLACDYCYYLEKKNLYAESKRHLITDELLEKFTKEYIELQTSDSVLFTWHGGEPMMRPVKFYERALELQRKYAGNKHIDNCFQTNGTLITDEWARFFKKNNFLVGVSIDGTQDMHDCYRRNRFGKASWEQVMRGIRTLNRHDVMWNAMAVVNDVNVERPLEFYRFFKEIGCRYIQFTPIVERYFRHPDGRMLASPIEGAIAEMTPFSITPEAWGRFLNAIFDEWVRHDVGEFFIQIFDSTLANWVGQPPSVCSLAETCGHATAMEHNGDLYVCDHFVFPEFKLGNLNNTPLKDLTSQQSLRTFGQNKKRLLTRQCQECEFLMACHGECPKNRFSTSADGERGHNYLCQGYHAFFSHVAPYMDFMKFQLQHRQAPANVMAWVEEGMPDYRR